MRTPLQKLIENLETSVHTFGNESDVKKCVQVCADMAKLYLQEEKDKIKTAYIDGIMDYKCGDDVAPEVYFNQLYNTK